ncbi:MAG: anti-sigma regulatory factor (Ser/Thr protein kinase) [Candidatus Azotimanducaceae bacterium]|jgi:anti-sigma regulatory factor (Ser/Thr protein kinase)|tara:strand:+ start:2683 stop:3078 length:396 start_codon:yes stop_codon:yes gene_type:complete
MTDLTESPPSADEAIEIGVPLRSEHAATLRVIVASLGSDNGLTIDEIDDLKLAVSEVFTVLIDDAVTGSGRAVVRFWSDLGTIRVHLTRDGDDLSLELDALARAILSSVVDDYTVDADGVMLVKRPNELTT